jgi:tRNA (guanine37-N1)-methyltransferase
VPLFALDSCTPGAGKGLFAILTLFPEAIEPYLRSSILGLAQERGLIKVALVDFRDFTRDRHRTVDDRPFGGGPGMVLCPEPIAECVEWLERRHGAFRKLALCPSGRPFRQALAEELSRAERVLLLGGRYEGFDVRILDALGFTPLSIGDFVLSGGELPALCVVEAAARLIPGVLGDEESARRDSFGGLPAHPEIDHPHYTRPRVWRGIEVPPVLLSGNHAEIERWRTAAASGKTRARRADLQPNNPHLEAEPDGLAQRHAPDRAD